MTEGMQDAEDLSEVSDEEQERERVRQLASEKISMLHDLMDDSVMDAMVSERFGLRRRSRHGTQ